MADLRVPWAGIVLAVLRDKSALADATFLLLDAVPRRWRGRLYRRVCRRQMKRWHPELRSRRTELDLIDAALEDYAVSGDAMRWAPDAPETTPAPAEVWHRGSSMRRTCGSCTRSLPVTGKTTITAGRNPVTRPEDLLSGARVGRRVGDRIQKFGCWLEISQRRTR